MTKHKITAIRMDQKGDVFTLTGITQSPRGTKTMAGRIQFLAPKTDRVARRSEIEQALTTLINGEE